MRDNLEFIKIHNTVVPALFESGFLLLIPSNYAVIQNVQVFCTIEINLIFRDLFESCGVSIVITQVPPYLNIFRDVFFCVYIISVESFRATESSWTS